MSDSKSEFVFELDAGLIMARLLGEEVMGPDLFDRLSRDAQARAGADGRAEISREDLRVACEALKVGPAVVGAGA